jgi:hypothetical protein
LAEDGTLVGEKVLTRCASKYASDVPRPNRDTSSSGSSE